MFLPKLTVEAIDPEQNVRFIIGYLSREKRENTSRPFFEKTIRLFPELKNIDAIEDKDDREAVIREAVLKKLNDHADEICGRIEHFQAVFDSFIAKNIEAQCRVFEMEWSKNTPVIRCYVGYLPFYPRSAADKCFYVSYPDEERVFSGAVHEINHMIFFEKWKEMTGFAGDEPAWPDPLWVTEEVIVDPILNDERVKPYTLYENKAYPQFYLQREDGTGSLMDRIKACYQENTGNIAGFLKEAYRIVLSVS